MIIEISKIYKSFLFDSIKTENTFLYFNEEKIVMISCGLCHSMALTESGRVFIWSNNK
jgi:alpha-tubulin suppressor-like RCC1 family protein